MFSEYHSLSEWLFAAVVVVFLAWPCVFYFRGRTSTFIASIVVGLHFAPCYWLTLFDPNWNGWVPSARVTHMLVMNGLFGDGRVNFYFRPSWWIAILVTAIIAFISIDCVKRRNNWLREVTDKHGLPPIY